jgi:hypothetical protein
VNATPPLPAGRRSLAGTSGTGRAEGAGDIVVMKFPPYLGALMDDADPVPTLTAWRPTDHSRYWKL